MTVPKILTVCTFLILLFVNVQAQIYDCRSIQDSANPFFNEMDGFKFFGEGKLRAFTLGVSDIDDARSTFGAPLKIMGFSEFFDYDYDWLIIFSYLTSNLSKTVSYTSLDGVTITKKHVIRPEYVGKINRIQLLPKRNFQFNKANYPDKTVKESPGERNWDYTYSDRYGLTYKVFNGEAARLGGDLKEYKLTLTPGDILEISYINPCLHTKIYVEQK